MREFITHKLPQLDGADVKVFLACWERCVGFGKQEDEIGVQQLGQMTGLSRRSVLNAITKLESADALGVTRRCKQNVHQRSVYRVPISAAVVEKAHRLRERWRAKCRPAAVGPQPPAEALPETGVVQRMHQGGGAENAPGWCSNYTTQNNTLHAENSNSERSVESRGSESTLARTSCRASPPPPEPAPPPLPEPPESEAVSFCRSQIEQIRDEFPRAFQVTNMPDAAERIATELAGLHPDELRRFWLGHVKTLFVRGREPGTANGPRGVGLLLRWARDYRETLQERAPEARHEAAVVSAGGRVLPFPASPPDGPELDFATVDPPRLLPSGLHRCPDCGATRGTLPGRPAPVLCLCGPHASARYASAGYMAEAVN